MMTVVFYISGHGFGHASREVEVINALGALGDRRGTNVRIIIRSAVSPSLLERTVRVPYELRPGICDTGLVQRTSVTQDNAATLDAANEFYATFDERAGTEAATLAGDRPDAIVCDIAPLGLAVAAALGVPSIFIGNFTWDWIYETQPGFLPGGADVIATIRRAQALATSTLQLPLSPSFDGTALPNVSPLPLIARRPTRSREETRAIFNLPQSRKLALLSFGGYGLSDLDLTRVDCANEWNLVATDRSVSGLDLKALPFVHAFSEADLAASAARYEDLVAAVDAVITKPGFGILGECIAASTPLLYTSRGDFREYDVLVAEMPRFLRSRFISQADLFSGRLLEPLNALIAQPAPRETLDPIGASVAAEVIFSRSSRRPAESS